MHNLSEITAIFWQLICRNKARIVAVNYVAFLARNKRTRSLPKSLRVQLTLIELHYRSACPSVVCGPRRPSTGPLSFTFASYEIASRRFCTRPRSMHSPLEQGSSCSFTNVEITAREIFRTLSN